MSLISASLVGEATAKGKFIARQNGTFTDSGGWWAQEFEVSGAPTQFAFYFAADYSATAAIFAPSQLSSFQNGGAFTAFALFDRKIGVDFPDLPPGSYYIGVRNANNGSNKYSLELDDAGQYPPEDGATLAGTVITETLKVGKNGGRSWVGFNLQSGFSHSVDGVNSGLETYLIPQNELSNFRSGGVFQYYESFSGTGANLPGYSELTLPPGTYYYAFHNPHPEEKSVVFSILKWNGAGGGGGGGLELERPASWEISDGRITLEASSVINRNNGTSGSLRLGLWFTTSPYLSGALSGYQVGRYDFTATLGPNQKFSNFGQIVGFTPPPDGVYHSVMTLSEWDGSEFVIRDHVTFDGTTEIGDAGGGGSIPIPATLSASDGEWEGFVEVGWSEVAAGHSYNLYRGTTRTFSSARKIVSEWDLESYLDFDATPGITYFYWITAVRDSDGSEGAPRGPERGIRADPTAGGQFDPLIPQVANLSATQGTSSISIELLWTPAASGFHQQIYRSTGNSFETATLIKDEWYLDEFLDIGMPLRTPLYYWIVVVRNSNNDFGPPSPGVLGHAGEIATKPFQDWIAGQGVPVDQRRRADDPDGDGRDNLAEMALGWAAGVPDGHSDIAIHNTAGSLILSYQASVVRQSGFDYIVEASDNGGRNWTPAGLSASADGVSNGRIRYSGTIEKIKSKRIFRLRIREK